MKAELEPKEMQFRGVFLLSETEEEKQVLTNIWNQKGGPAMLGRMRDGNVQLVIAPSPEEKGGEAHV